MEEFDKQIRMSVGEFTGEIFIRHPVEDLKQEQNIQVCSSGERSEMDI